MFLLIEPSQQGEGTMGKAWSKCIGFLLTPKRVTTDQGPSKESSSKVHLGRSILLKLLPGTWTTYKHNLHPPKEYPQAIVNGFIYSERGQTLSGLVSPQMSAGLIFVSDGCYIITATLISRCPSPCHACRTVP